MARGPNSPDWGGRLYRRGVRWPEHLHILDEMDGAWEVCLEPCPDGSTSVALIKPFSAAMLQLMAEDDVRPEGEKHKPFRALVSTLHTRLAISNIPMVILPRGRSGTGVPELKVGGEPADNRHLAAVVSYLMYFADHAQFRLSADPRLLESRPDPADAGTLLEEVATSEPGTLSDTTLRALSAAGLGNTVFRGFAETGRIAPLAADGPAGEVNRAVFDAICHDYGIDPCQAAVSARPASSSPGGVTSR